MFDQTERLARLPTAAISDVLRNLQASYAMDASIKSIVLGLHVAGPAFTVLARAGSIITVHRALLEAPSGSILVVGGETFQNVNAALFGKMMATQARLRGLAALVVDGVVRDAADLREMRFPVFARGTTPHVGMNRVLGQIQVPVPCGGLIVHPGDYLVGDDDGVVVVPVSLADQVVALAESKLLTEANYVKRMQTGEQLADLIGFRELIYGKK